VVARDRMSQYRPAEAETWTAPLRGEWQPSDVAEEGRILYVAITRARQYCAIAMPVGTAHEVVGSLQRAGFMPQRLMGG
jgi:ATP-dependent exoDNAse (exonuclease V) beta subunit